MAHEKLIFMLKELSVSLYTDLSDTEKPVLAPSLTNILRSRPESLIKNLQSLYSTLVSSQSSIKSSNFFEKFAENEEYQKALQKLDSEVRKHIKRELQMKVFIESLDEKIAKINSARLHSKNKETEILQEIIQENKKILIKIDMKNKEIDELRAISNGSEEYELFALREKVGKESEKICWYERNEIYAMKKCTDTKIELEFLIKEYERCKTQFFSLKARMDNYGVPRSLSRSKEHTELIKDTKKNSRPVTPTPPERSISPTPLTYKQKISKYAQNITRTERLEHSPLCTALQSDRSKSKLKPLFQIYSKKKT